LIIENSIFISFDGAKLVSHIKTYENDVNQKIHLIPVVHLGTAEYYYNILAYVGSIPCLYESVKFGPESNKPREPVKNVDDYIELYSISCDKVWNEYNSLISNFNRKFLSKDVKKLHKFVRKKVHKSNDKLRQIYELCKKTNFSFSNVMMIQLYWCEILKLEHQWTAIDYENDISKQSNWIHTDIDLEGIQDQKDVKEAIRRILTSPTSEEISQIQKEMYSIIGMIWQSVELYRMLDSSQRRRELANTLIDMMTTQYQVLETQAPELLLNTRNVMIEDSIINQIEDNNELMIFYGAIHMISIEKFLLDAGFKFKTEDHFEVFDINL
jgi:hypothetical protein